MSDQELDYTNEHREDFDPDQDGFEEFQNMMKNKAREFKCEQLDGQNANFINHQGKNQNIQLYDQQVKLISTEESDSESVIDIKKTKQLRQRRQSQNSKKRGRKQKSRSISRSRSRSISCISQGKQ